MAQIINTNIASLNAQRNLNSSQSSLNTSLERLSSGLRINSAKDDAAGLAIAERFTSQIRGLDQATRNSNDGISFAQTAEGALGEVGNAIQRIRELAVQSANDTNSAEDRQALNDEVQQLISEVDRISKSTEFNGQKILDGTLPDLNFQVGANQNQTISVDGADSRASQLGAQLGEGDAALSGDFTDGLNLGDLDGESLTIQGVEIDLSDLDADSTSLNEVVTRINQKSADTGVNADLATEVDETLSFAEPDADGTLEVNGVEVAIAADDDIDDVVKSINSFSDQTGVTAEKDGSDLRLQSNSDIELAVTGGGNLDIQGLQDGDSGAVFRGIELSTEVDTDINVGGDDSEKLGLDGIGTGEANRLNAQSVATREEANSTIQTADFALQQVNGLRATLGAVQTRFESTIANLETGSENLNAARSRIQDADFAAETANLTRAQILQQAGTSVLSQANQTPQNVLSLLQ